MLRHTRSCARACARASATGSLMAISRTERLTLTGPSVGQLARRGLHVMAALPYDTSALSPAMPTEAIVRHREHEAEVVGKLNSILAGTELEHRGLDEIITATSNDAEHAQCFNYAAEAWNHEFFWSRLTPGGAKPPDELLQWIARDFGSFDGLTTQLHARARGLFGSGWSWLVLDRETLRLHIVNSTALIHPLGLGLKPLVAVDMWEHAYLVSGVDREEYVRSVLSLVNWELVCDDLLAAVNLSDEQTKLKYLVRLSMEDMKKLKHVMVHHGVLELPAAPHLTKLDFLPADEDVGVDFDSPLDAAMADATRAAIQRRARERS